MSLCDAIAPRHATNTRIASGTSTKSYEPVSNSCGISPVRPARSLGLVNDVQDALAKVPEVFDRTDICRILGYVPDRGS